jgi:protein phosphatase
MYVEIAGCTDTGRIREHNEDCIDHDDKLGLAVLADGMGGYQSGEVASAIAVNVIMKELGKKMTSWFHHHYHAHFTYNNYHYATQRLEQAVLKANQVIYQTAQTQAQYRGMGTTVVAVLFNKTWMSIAHVGDSRLYRYRNHDFHQLTKDHTVVQELMDAGLITPQQARYDSRRHLLTRAVGIEIPVQVELQEQEVLTEDIYLLCSDGLNDMLEDHTIQTILQQNFSHSLKQTAQLLIKVANDKGGEDNISLILIRRLPTQKNWLQQLFHSHR